MRTEGERHRLIRGYMHLVPMLASGFRGAKGIPIDELEGEARVGLVEAERDWRGADDFGRFANTVIRRTLINFIRDWKTPSDYNPEDAIPGSDSATEFYEWQNWSDSDYSLAIAEFWTDLAASPEDLVIAFDQIKNAGAALRSAMIGLTRRERQIMEARYFTRPQSSIETIARHHKISYARTVFLIDRVLKNIRKILESRDFREAATPSAARGWWCDGITGQ